MAETFCLYFGPAFENGEGFGGTVNMKTREGYALVAFADATLARRFQELTGLRDHRVLPLAQLGDALHPIRSKLPLARPSLKITFASENVLEQWHRDRENFHSAPHITELD